MNAKILFFKYTDGSGCMIVRVYLEKDFDQAAKDLEMMNEFASDCKNWKLEDAPVFGKSTVTEIYDFTEGLRDE